LGDTVNIDNPASQITNSYNNKSRTYYWQFRPLANVSNYQGEHLSITRSYSFTNRSIDRWK